MLVLFLDILKFPPVLFHVVFGSVSRLLEGLHENRMISFDWSSHTGPQSEVICDLMIVFDLWFQTFIL